MPAAVESMFSTKITPWHREGIVLEEYPNTDEAYINSGLNWSVEKSPLFYNVNGEYFKTDMFALIRDKDNKPLGSCKDAYKIFQNLDGFEWCRPLVESGMWKYESAGALRGGVIGWILLNQGEVELVKNDKLEQYLLLTWSHDGSKCIQALPTSIRVVCNNTLTQALNTAVFKNKVRHSEKMTMKLEEIKKMYSESKETFAHQNEVFSKMLDFKMTEGMISEYVDNVLNNAYGVKNVDEMEESRGKTTALKVKATLLDAAYNGSGTKELGIGNTMYAVFNGIEEAVEHSLGGNRVKDRGYNILFGTGKQIVDTAYNTSLMTMGIAA